MAHQMLMDHIFVDSSSFRYGEKSGFNDWGIRDNARDTENPRTKVLRWNVQDNPSDAGYLEEQDRDAYGINFCEGFQIVSGAGETIE